MNYLVSLESKNEGVKYTENNNSYWFDVDLQGSEWELNLLGYKNEQEHELTEKEMNTVIPRIVKYLENVKFLFVFGKSYTVKFVRIKPLKMDELAQQEIDRGCEVIKHGDGSFTVYPPKE